MSNSDALEIEIDKRADVLPAQEQKTLAFVERSGTPIPLAEARYHLTQTIVWVFIICLFAVFVIIAANGDKDRALFLVDVMKTMLLPLVTLMIGHYFGSKND